MDKVYVVFGDVHGEAELLRRLIEKVKEKYREQSQLNQEPFPEIEFYSLGDLVDRGPDSKGVLDLCVKENIKGILGNHDQWLYDLVVHHRFDPFCLKPIMGGKNTLHSFGVDWQVGDPKEMSASLLSKLTIEQKDWIRQQKPYRLLEVGGKRYWLVHAGLTTPVAKNHLSKDQNWDGDRQMLDRIVKNSLDSILWPTPQLGSGKVQRSGEASDNLYHFHDAVQIFGHRPVDYPIQKDHFIALDTGCGTCEPFTLSAIILPTMEIVQVQAEISWIH